MHSSNDPGPGFDQFPAQPMKWPWLILESIRDFSIFTIGVDSRITSWNAGAENMLGYAEKEIVGRLAEILFVPEDRVSGAAAHEMAKAAREGRAENERWHLRKDQVRFYGSGMTHSIRDEQGKLLGFVKVMRDLTESIRTRDALQASEDRQAYLLKLSDALRSLSDPDEIQAEATRVLVEQLEADRAAYFQVEGGEYKIRAQAARGVGPMKDRYSIESIGRRTLEQYARGEPTVVPDVAKFHRPEDLPHLASVPVGAYIGVPLAKAGVFMGGLTVQAIAPRTWTPGEVGIVGETAERTWAAVQQAQMARERAQAEASLRQSEARFRALAEASSEAHYRMNADWSELLELSDGGFMAGTRQPNSDWLKSYIPAEGRESFGEALNTAIRAGRAFTLEHPVRRIDGSRGWALTKAVPVLGPDRKITEWYGAASDITVRKQAEEDRDMERQRLAAMFEALPIGVGVVDARGKLLLTNCQLQRFMPPGLMLSPEEPFLRRWRAASPDGQPSLAGNFPVVRALRGEKVVPGIEMAYTSDDGSVLWTQVAGVPLRTGNGTVTGAVAVVIDIDAHKRAEDQLREADRRKSDFLAMLGHELRNPLAAVEGGLKLLQSPRAQPASREAALPLVAQQVEHMKRLIDDVLDLARLDRGKMPVNLEEIELRPVIEAAVHMVDTRAHLTGAELRQVWPDTPIRLRGDSHRLIQVFVNLLSNALKFSHPKSPIDLSVRVEAGWVVISVRDYGRGITPEHLPEIFEPFVQSKLSLGIPEGGLGLGLAVARELVTLHHGTLDATSEGENRGSEFIVRLPLSSPP